MKYYIIHKPFGYLSQFTREMPEHRVLGDLFDFPKDVYAVGRLDRDSEGLLILTNDKTLNHRLLNPNFKHKRTYWVQVEGIPTAEAITALENGVDIKINKKIHRTLPASCKAIEPVVEERDPPVRFRQNIPTSWLELTLVEGKNRQVRRMCAKVGFPVLRLFRYSIEGLSLADLERGAVREIEKNALLKLLKLSK